MLTNFNIFTTKSWDELHDEMKKLAKGSENAPAYLRHLMIMFVVDFEQAVTKRLDVKFWIILKKLIDDMSATSEDRIVAENVYNLAFGFLTDLCLVVHSTYEVPKLGLPSFLTFSSGVLGKRKELKSVTKAKMFCAFVMMRMGDLMRYKGHDSKAKQYYTTSVEINQADGAAWNQLGIMSYKSAKWLESVYCHTRALHSTIPFPAASANLSSIFKKFANRDTSKDMPINEKCVSILAKLHFLMKIEGGEKILKKVGEKMAKSKEFIVSLMGVYENLEEGTDLEKKAVDSVAIIWERAFRVIVDEMEEQPTDENVHLLALYLRIPEFCDLTEESVTMLQESRGDGVFADVHRFDHFKCLKENMLKYPLTCASFENWAGDEIETEDQEQEYETDDEKDSAGSSMSDSPVNLTSASSSSKMQQKAASSLARNDDDSEEEILQRGARRGRVMVDDYDSEDDY